MHRLSIAPMLDCTDRHYRFFARCLTRHAKVYSEMVTTKALLHGDLARHLDYNAPEHPIALQLGGSDPAELAQCAKLAQRWAYDEINLNVGCPSDRVLAGEFGACLMRTPTKVANCVKAMRDAVDIDVTVKHRIGLDQCQDYEVLHCFVETVAQAGCRLFIVHARNAILHGLSPKENRTIPPLNYSYVYRLKKERPDLTIILNGGVRTLLDIDQHLCHVDGVMLGRAAYEHPYSMSQWDARYFADSHPIPSRQQVLDRWLPYARRQLSEGVPLRHLTRALLGLFYGEAGARQWRKIVSQAQSLDDL